MRLFVALDIPESVRTSLAALVPGLRAMSASARWVRIESLHVTLKFIGEVTGEKVEPIKTALTDLPSRTPFPINFRGLGFFPNGRHPRVLWVGIEAGSELAVLAASVEATLSPLGIAPGERAFAPHLTLARFDAPRGLEALHTAIEKATLPEFGNATAKEFHLYQSVLKRGGAEYTRLATFSFAGSKPD